MNINLDIECSSKGFRQYHVVARRFYPFKVASDQIGNCTTRSCVGPTLRATAGLAALYQSILEGHRIAKATGRSRSFFQGGSENLEGEDDVKKLYGGRYQILKNIGEGTFSNILSARDTFRDGGRRIVALKISKHDHEDIGRCEIQCLRTLNRQSGAEFCPILMIGSAFTHLGRTCMTMELLQTDLQRYTVRNQIGLFGGVNIKPGSKNMPCFSVAALRTISLKLVSGLLFLEKHGIIHADIKPSNVLLSVAGEPVGSSPDNIDHLLLGKLSSVEDGLIDRLMVKICDFGNAFHSSESCLYHDRFELQTLTYRAPEVLHGCPFGTSIDVYSLGILLLELVIGKSLFASNLPRKAIAIQTACAFGPPPKLCFEKGKYFDHYWGIPPQSNEMLGCCSCCWTGREGSVSSYKHMPTTCKGNCAVYCNRYKGQQLDSSHINRLLHVRPETSLLPRRHPDFAKFLNGLLESDPEVRLNPRTALLSPFFGPAFPFCATGPISQIHSNTDELFARVLYLRDLSKSAAEKIELNNSVLNLGENNMSYNGNIFSEIEKLVELSSDLDNNIFNENSTSEPRESLDSNDLKLQIDSNMVLQNPKQFNLDSSPNCKNEHSIELPENSESEKHTTNFDSEELTKRRRKYLVLSPAPWIKNALLAAESKSFSIKKEETLWSELTLGNSPPKG